MEDRFKRQVVKLLAEAELATNAATSGLLDRTDCLELIARLVRVTERLLSMSDEASPSFMEADVPLPRLYSYPQALNSDRELTS
jgi:hypothetical protein